MFITAFSRYAPEAFEVEAADYDLKPFSDQQFGDELQRAKRRVRERRLGDLAGQWATMSSELRRADGALEELQERVSEAARVQT